MGDPMGNRFLGGGLDGANKKKSVQNLQNRQTNRKKKTFFFYQKMSK